MSWSLKALAGKLSGEWIARHKCEGMGFAEQEKLDDTQVASKANNIR